MEAAAESREPQVLRVDSNEANAKEALPMSVKAADEQPAVESSKAQPPEAVKSQPKAKRGGSRWVSALYG